MGTRAAYPYRSSYDKEFQAVLCPQPKKLVRRYQFDAEATDPNGQKRTATVELDPGTTFATLAGQLYKLLGWHQFFRASITTMEDVVELYSRFDLFEQGLDNTSSDLDSGTETPELEDDSDSEHQTYSQPPLFKIYNRGALLAELTAIEATKRLPCGVSTRWNSPQWYGLDEQGTRAAWAATEDECEVRGLAPIERRVDRARAQAGKPRLARHHRVGCARPTTRRGLRALACVTERNASLEREMVRVGAFLAEETTLGDMYFDSEDEIECTMKWVVKHGRSSLGSIAHKVTWRHVILQESLDDVTIVE